MARPTRQLQSLRRRGLRLTLGVAAGTLLAYYAVIVGVALGQAGGTRAPLLRDAAFLLPLPVGYLAALVAAALGGRLAPGLRRPSGLRVLGELLVASLVGAAAGITALPVSPFAADAGAQAPMGVLWMLPMMLVGP